MRLMRRRGLLFATQILLLCAAVPNLAAQDQRELTIRKAVDQFCAWDSDGARLSSKHPHWKDEEALLADSPAWPEEPIDLVAGYRIGTITTDGERRRVEVQYRLLAEIRGGLERNGFTTARRRQTVWLPLVQAGSQWKIDASALAPHVSPEAMSRYVEQIRKDDEEAGDHHRQELLTTLIAEIRRTGASIGESGNRKPVTRTED
jgi:hypothetical protein